jgi:hypothetical protein
VGRSGRSGRGRRLISLTIAVAALVVSTATPSLAANSPPETSVTSPVYGAAFLPGADVPFVGTAADDIGVNQVRVSLQNAVTKQWWHANGTWGATEWHVASLARPGNPTTGWNWTWPNATEGSFVLHAQARDTNGVRDLSHATRKIVVTPAAETKYLTLSFGRTQWVTARQCAVMPNTVTLGEVADEMTLRGLTGTGNVVMNRASETSTQACMTYGLMSTWAQIAGLRDTHGWSFVSAGQAYRDMTSLTTEQQIDESCDSLADLEAHGHPHGWGLFAYPNNKKSFGIQSSIVSTCFSYGRGYDYRNNEVGAMVSPWFQRTYSVNGGACNATGLWCSSLANTGAKYIYRSRESLASLMQPGAGEWSVVQMYRFVEGAQTSPSFKWDCTDPDPNKHWVSNSELYCIDDFLWALEQIPDDVVVTNPATVAEAWGRGNPNT